MKTFIEWVHTDAPEWVSLVVTISTVAAMILWLLTIGYLTHWGHNLAAAAISLAPFIAAGVAVWREYQGRGE